MSVINTTPGKLLPPTKEVWGKVMFSEACVSHSVHRLEWVCLQGDLPRGGGLPGGSVSRGSA